MQPPKCPIGMRRGKWPWPLLLGPLLLMIACGGTEEQAPPVAGEQSSSAEAASAPRREFDVDVELRGPARKITGHPTTLPDWADPLRARIDPEMDDSWREKIAVRFEQSCEAAIRALLEGNETALRAQLAETFEGSSGLFPLTELELRFDDGSFVVKDREGSESELESLEQLLERLDDWDWRGFEGCEITASVVGSHCRR